MHSTPQRLYTQRECTLAVIGTGGPGKRSNIIPRGDLSIPRGDEGREYIPATHADQSGERTGLTSTRWADQSGEGRGYIPTGRQRKTRRAKRRALGDVYARFAI
eukprot:1032691-Prorocentrum_minimum.AAC.2